jgi:hypothetical protein
MLTAFPANPSQRVTNNVSSVVLLESSVYDLSSNFTSGGYFVAPVTGYYQVNASVGYINGVAGKRYMATLYNSTTAQVIATGISQAAGTANISAHVSDVVFLTAADALALYTYQDSGGYAYLEYNSPLTFMSVQLVREVL